jgi:hypothetical protein
MGFTKEGMGLKKKDVPLGKKLGQGKDGPWDMSCPKEKVIMARTLSFTKDHFIVYLTGGQGM